MSVNLTMSATSGGSDLPEENSLGTVSAGSSSSVKDVFISHDAVVNPITDVELYALRDVSSSYPGVDADADIAMLFGWSASDTTKGIQLNMNPSVPSWQPMKAGSGDVANPITLDEDSIIVGTPAGDGVIPVAGEANIQLKVSVPSPAGTGAGTYAFSVAVAYSATS